MQPHTFNPKTTGEIGRNPNLLAKSSNPFRHQVAASPSGPCRICCRCFPERQMVCQVDGLDLFETLEHMRKIPAGKPRPPNPQEKPLVSSGSLVTRLVASLGDDWFSLFFCMCCICMHLVSFGVSIPFVQKRQKTTVRKPCTLWVGNPSILFQSAQRVATQAIRVLFSFSTKHS